MNAKEIIKFDFSSPPPPNILIQDTPLQAQKILSSPPCSIYNDSNVLCFIFKRLFKSDR